VAISANASSGLASKVKLTIAVLVLMGIAALHPSYELAFVAGFRARRRFAHPTDSPSCARAIACMSSMQYASSVFQKNS
jgi:hypothetical protein